MICAGVSLVVRLESGDKESLEGGECLIRIPPRQVGLVLVLVGGVVEIVGLMLLVLIGRDGSVQDRLRPRMQGQIQ